MAKREVRVRDADEEVEWRMGNGVRIQKADVERRAAFQPTLLVEREDSQVIGYCVQLAVAQTPVYPAAAVILPDSFEGSALDQKAVPGHRPPLGHQAQCGQPLL